MHKADKLEKEKVLPVTSMGMKSFMGKNLSSSKKDAKPGLFDNLKFKSKGKDSSKDKDSKGKDKDKDKKK